MLGVLPDKPGCQRCATLSAVRHTELWARLEAALGSDYYRHWASTQVLAGLDGRTVTEALAAGASAKQVWAEVRTALDLPLSER